MLRLRFKLSDGNQHTLSIENSKTMHDLKVQLLELTQIPADQIRLRQAFPPSKTIEALSECRSGDTFMVERIPAADVATPPSSNSNNTAKSQSPKGDSGGQMVKRSIADDNSCLFNSIGYVLMQRDRTRSTELRQLIVSTVMKDPINYSDLVLGRPREEYCRLMMSPQTWGGAIELKIFAEHFRTEIVAIDVETCKPYRFGEGNGFPQRVFLLYSGIHYDALALSPFGERGSETLDKTVFDATDDLVFAQALAVAEQERKARRYTNTTTFTLKCLKCSKALVGQAEAQQHAQQTGHTDFSEY